MMDAATLPDGWEPVGSVFSPPMYGKESGIVGVAARVWLTAHGKWAWWITPARDVGSAAITDTPEEAFQQASDELDRVIAQASAKATPTFADFVPTWEKLQTLED